MKITIIYDNHSDNRLRSGWGFSCLIEAKEKILFDTGDNGKDLIHNMKQLGIKPENINKVVISHNHWDHVDGLEEFRKSNHNAQVFHPKSFSKRSEISPSVYSTGALGTFIKEQSLIVKTDKGNIVITGCAHPGLGKILKAAEPLGGIHGVIGGFHGFSDFKQFEGIELIGPCHCTRHISRIRQIYPDQFKKIQAGSVIEIP